MVSSFRAAITAFVATFAFGQSPSSPAPSNRVLSGGMAQDIPVDLIAKVGVGTTIAHDPLHRSGQAELPHPAPTLGEDAQAHERIRMTNTSRWEPSRKIAPHAAPRQVVTLTATAQDRPPQITHGFAKSAQGRAVHGHPVIAEV